MKHFIALVLGLLAGALLFALGMTYNPFVVDRSLSPLAVTDEEVMILNFSAVPAEAILFTNAGDRPIKPSPAKVQQLWEETIHQSSVMVAVMRDARNQTAGLGIKFSSLSERTRLLNGEVLLDSTWYVFLPDRGSLFIEQSENYWDVLREVYIPAYRNSAKSWKGSWIGDVTDGPGVLGTAIVTGGTGSLRGITMQSSESLTLNAYSIDDGPVSAAGRLLIEMPKVVQATTAEASGR